MSSTTCNGNTEKPEDGNCNRPAGAGPVVERSSSSGNTTKGQENCGAPTLEDDPLRRLPSPYVREREHVILIFADGRQLFAQCLKRWRGKTPPLKISKRSYSTANLIGLPYGTVLELGPSGLSPLPEGEGLLPRYTINSDSQQQQTATQDQQQSESDDANASDTTFPPIAAVRDNRHIVDSNTSQALGYDDLQRLRDSGTDGSVIVNKIIENSATFDQKTDFSKAKYVARKQMKYQPRCRLVRCTASTLCEALFIRDPKKLMNLREDTLGQILSYSNISAGCQILVCETCSGVVTGAVAQRMGGYGRILSVYSGQQPSYSEMLQRYNLNFAENTSIKWVHSSDVFGGEEDPVEKDDSDTETKAEREKMEWPCELQDHTRAYLKDMKTQREKEEFLAKRSARFARKLTRHTDAEAREWLTSRKSDCLILAARFDPVTTLLKMLRFLAPACPFVVYSEFIEPLTECFRELQEQELAINLRLSDTWTREYQVLPGRTHPNMNMSQSGGFLLTGVKLDPETGKNDLDEELIKEIRAHIGGRRGKRKTEGKNRKTRSSSASPEPSKRQRIVENGSSKV